MERFRPVVAVEQRWLPREKVGIRGAECLPTCRGSGLHANADEDHVRPRDRLVVQSRLSVRRRVAFELITKTLQGDRWRHGLQIGPYDLHMLLVMKLFGRHRAGFESRD